MMPEKDPDIADYIENLPRHLTFTRIAEACRKQFGSRAWSRSQIMRYWRASHPVKTGRKLRVDIDAEVRAFVDDRLGRMTLREIAAKCVATFGSERAPSRSGIHRYWMNIRNER
jgi:hypothetical protein